MAKFYAVRNGRKRDVFNTWSECQSQVNGFSGAEFKSFSTHDEALAYIKAGSGARQASSGPLRRPRASTGNQAASFSSSRKRPYPASSPRGKLKSGNQSTIAPSTPQSSFKNPSTTAEKMTVVYTDGSSLGNGRSGAKAGWASFWGPDDPRNRAGPVLTGEQTNNRGELIAIYETLKVIDSESREGTGSDAGYLIMSDSQYARDSLDKWVDGWISKGWKVKGGTVVKNRDIIEPAHKLLKDLRSRGVQTQIEYVPAHSGHAGNESADLMARAAARESH